MNITSEISIDEIEGTTKPMEHLCESASLPEKSNLHISKCCMDKYLKNYTLLNAYRNENLTYLKYKVLEHRLVIHLPQEVKDKSEHIIKINFKTRPEGPSLMWTSDQSNMPCVFTVGHQLNNRSLFPSQDMPQAMSTWHCFITLGPTENDKTTVLMTGEAPANVIKNDKNETVYQFSNSYPMPASTFALAVGSWTLTDLSGVIQANERSTGRYLTPTCHLFSPSNLEGQSTDLMSRYLPECFRSLDTVLGPYPLKHLNILIVPDCFDSLGMASPHLILLSQSVLCPDMSMLLRLAHELCHTWFGILTGPCDWTEEWLTEGVCCYLEDIVHGMIMDWDAERLNLRALIKYKLLAAEMANTSEHLQTLRPNVGADETRGLSDNKEIFVKNGLDPEKTLIQVHYLKGYFLLLSLEQVAGKQFFLVTLKTFINERLGQLFSSQEFLVYIFDHCTALGLAGLTVDSVCQEWLDYPGMPKQLLNFPSVQSNKLVRQVDTLISELKAVSSRKRQRGQRLTPSRAGLDKILSTELTPEQRILFLDLVMEEGISLTSLQLEEMREIWRIPEANAEVQHSWCELVIHSQAIKWSADVKDFLVNHQALGVYLYGELMISENPRLQQLAHECYSRTQMFMPEGPKSVVRAMLFP
ncbi:unnamed protein product [Lymnaea stagnalis]|uniref:Peptidase M1 leukotriene A4 hydrolase/aminopeptidase C-terminal domain-containing protein n=1 Tax=Lymnaea stagnalis TaxID=6523 RepID=A0AAV2IL82_LYMST